MENDEKQGSDIKKRLAAVNQLVRAADDTQQAKGDKNDR